MLTPSRMMSLGLPLLLGYLTWSTVDTGVGGLGTIAQVPTAIHYKVRDGGAPTDVSPRDPFSQEAQEVVADILAGPASAVLGPAAVEHEESDSTVKQDQMKLMGTAIMGKLRIAIVDGVRLREGERYRGLQVAVITAERVIFTDSQGRNLTLMLDIATSEEIGVALAQSMRADPAKPKAPPITARPPLQRGLAALSGTGSQTEILRMLGIPES